MEAGALARLRVRAVVDLTQYCAFDTKGRFVEYVHDDIRRCSMSRFFPILIIVVTIY